MIGRILRLNKETQENQSADAIEKETLLILLHVLQGCIAASQRGESGWAADVTFSTNVIPDDYGMVAGEVERAVQTDSKLLATVGYHVGDRHLSVFIGWG